ncbi:sensor histidine kinase [Microbacterium natoriense]|uniref:sensor histidine kinase n=1 Tax=Microbacterium natoriense TaxID=284570 RepID=UPI0027D83E61|nr:histidine kinase [Microbacterium natoriense]
MLLRIAFALAHLLLGIELVEHVGIGDGAGVAVIPLVLLGIFAVVSVTACWFAPQRRLGARCVLMLLTVGAFSPYAVLGGTGGWPAWLILIFEVGALLPLIGSIALGVGAIIFAGANPVFGGLSFVDIGAGVAICAVVSLLGAAIGLSTRTATLLRTTREQLLPNAVSIERTRILHEIEQGMDPYLEQALQSVVAAQLALEGDAERARDLVQDAHRIVRSALQEMRRSVLGYRRTDLDAQVMEARSSLASAGIDVTISGSSAQVPAAARETAAHLIREATSNVLRHSNARVCTISLRKTSVTVADDRRGRSRADACNKELDDLAQYVAAAGGALSLDVHAQTGFAITGRWAGENPILGVAPDRAVSDDPNEAPPNAPAWDRRAVVLVRGGVAGVHLTAVLGIVGAISQASSPSQQLVSALSLSFFAAVSVVATWWSAGRQAGRRGAGLWFVIPSIVPYVLLDHTAHLPALQIVIFCLLLLLPTARIVPVIFCAAIIMIAVVTWTTHGMGVAISAIVILGVSALFAVVIRATAADGTQLRFAQANELPAAVRYERLRIARDLHDSLGNTLSAAAAKAALVGLALDRVPSRATDPLLELEQYVRHAQRQMRDVVYERRLPTLREELVVGRDTLEAIGVKMVVNGTADDVPATIAPAAAFLVREAITNILRHSTKVSICTVTLTRSEIVVADDGEPRKSDTNRGTGLLGITERMDLAGATATFGPRSARGFKVAAHWTVEEHR